MGAGTGVSAGASGGKWRRSSGDGRASDDYIMPSRELRKHQAA